MSQKRFYIRHGAFANVYELAYAEFASDDAKLRAIGFQRTTRREALARIKRENFRRQYDALFAGYADNCVWPAMRFLLETREFDAAHYVEEHYKLTRGIWEIVT